MKTLTKREVEILTNRLGIAADAITEADEDSMGDTVSRLIMIADKYGKSRNKFLEDTALVFMATVIEGDFTNFEIPEHIKEFVERN